MRKSSDTCIKVTVFYYYIFQCYQIFFYPYSFRVIGIFPDLSKNENSKMTKVKWTFYKILLKQIKINKKRHPEICISMIRTINKLLENYFKLFVNVGTYNICSV